jgi:hypothetical protein
MPSAKSEVCRVFPEAEVVRAIFGLVVLTTRKADGFFLGAGSAYYEEETWLSAMEADEFRNSAVAVESTIHR